MINVDGKAHITVEEFANRVGLTKSYIYRKVREGEINKQQDTAPWLILIPETEVERWTAQRKEK